MLTLRSTIKNVLSVSAHLFGLRFLTRITGQRLILPFYHTVSDDDLPHIKHLYPIVPTTLFRQSLDFYQKYYTPISSKTLLDNINQNCPIKENNFHLSFDDGFRECHDVIAPILLEKGIPATFFINSAFVDNKDLFFRLKASILIEQITKKGLSPGQEKQIAAIFFTHNIHFLSPADFLHITEENKEMLNLIAPVVDIDFNAYLSEHQPYLTSQQIERLIQKGFTIGSHSVSHPRYDKLPEEAQIAQTIDCLHFLSENFNVIQRLFSFPYTDHGIRNSFFEKIKQEVQLSFGTAGLKPDPIPTHFQRIPMEAGDCNPINIIKTEYIYFILKKLVGKHVIRRN